MMPARATALYIVSVLALGAQNAKRAELTQGRVQWPAEYVLEVMRPVAKVSDGKLYLSNVVQNLLLDELSLQRKAVTRNLITPDTIEYPVRKDHEQLPADEREKLLEKYPKPVVLPLRINRHREVQAADVSCKTVKADRYVLLTRIALEGSRLRIGVELCQGGNSLHAQSATADEQEMVATIVKLMNPVRAKLTGDAFATLEIDSTPPRSSVYLDDQFLGKTPLRYSYLIPGEYRLVLKLDGHQVHSERIKTVTGETLKRTLTLAPAVGIGSLDITTDPAGAKIYIDADFKGYTPKKIEGLSEGTYRIHLLHPEKGEVYKTIQVTTQKKDFKLSETLSGFLDKSPAGLLGFSYKTWYYASLIAAAASFGTAIGFYVWRDQAREQELGRLSGKSTTLYTQEDYDFLNEKNAAYDTRNSYATGFMVSSGVFAALAIYFYVQHLLSADEGIVMKPKKSEEGSVDVRVGAMPGLSGVSVHYRF